MGGWDKRFAVALDAWASHIVVCPDLLRIDLDSDQGRFRLILRLADRLEREALLITAKICLDHHLAQLFQ